MLVLFKACSMYNGVVIYVSAYKDNLFTPHREIQTNLYVAVYKKPPSYGLTMPLESRESADLADSVFE